MAFELEVENGRLPMPTVATCDWVRAFFPNCSTSRSWQLQLQLEQSVGIFVSTFSLKKSFKPPYVMTQMQLQKKTIVSKFLDESNLAPKFPSL